MFRKDFRELYNNEGHLYCFVSEALSVLQILPEAITLLPLMTTHEGIHLEPEKANFAVGYSDKTKKVSYDVFLMNLFVGIAILIHCKVSIAQIYVSSATDNTHLTIHSSSRWMHKLISGWQAPHRRAKCLASVGVPVYSTWCDHGGVRSVRFRRHSVLCCADGFTGMGMSTRVFLQNSAKPDTKLMLKQKLSNSLFEMHWENSVSKILLYQQNQENSN